MDSKRLFSMDPASYSVDDVGAWLEMVGFGNVAAQFRKNGIDGMTLLELELSELTALGVAQLGPRKQLMRKISNLKDQKSSAWTTNMEQESSTSESGSQSHSHSHSHSHSQTTTSRKAPRSSSSKVTIKISYEGEIFVVRAKRTEKYKAIKKRIDKELGFEAQLKYDSDGDRITIKDRKGWKSFFLDALEEGTAIKLFAAPNTDANSAPSGVTIPAAVQSVYAAMGDAAFLIDHEGRILFLNDAAVAMFQWTANEAVGQNIKIIMDNKDAQSHDFYLHRYSRDPSNPRLVGKGSRLVIGMAKDRSTVPANLSISALKTESGATYFAGVLTPAVETSSDPAAKYEVLNGLLSPALVIDTDGDVLFVNQAVSQQLGYLPVDLLGDNINRIVPEPHHSKHDEYLSNYLTTGVAKVIGTKRKLQVQHKDGRKLPCNLTVTQMGRGDDRTFTGVVELVEAEELGGTEFVEKQKKKLYKLMVSAVLMDGNGVLRACNGAFTRMFGYEQDEISGQNVKMLMPENTAVKHDSYLRFYHKNPDKESTVVGKGRQVSAMGKDGKLFVAFLAVKRYQDTDGLAFFLGTFQPM